MVPAGRPGRRPRRARALLKRPAVLDQRRDPQGVAAEARRPERQRPVLVQPVADVDDECHGQESGSRHRAGGVSAVESGETGDPAIRNSLFVYRPRGPVEPGRKSAAELPPFLSMAAVYRDRLRVEEVDGVVRQHVPPTGAARPAPR
jgi:hypothetical protein